MEKKKILLVDDDKQILPVLETVLSGHGYAVSSADNGRDALKLIEKKTFDLVITDIVMQGIDGLQLLAETKHSSPGTAVILITGYMGADKAVAALQTGADDYVIKPFESEELVTKIEQILEKAATKKELRQTEKILQEREKKYRILVTTMFDAVLVINADTLQIIETNTACEDLFGYTKEEFSKLTLLNLSVAPERSLANVNKAKDEKILFIPLQYNKKKDGTIFPVEISASSFLINGDQYICGVVRDITERMKIETSLRESEIRYRTIVNNITDALIIHDLNGVITDVNENTCGMLGYARDELIGANLSMTTTAARKQNIPILMQKLSAQGSLNFDAVLVRKDGNSIIVNVSARVVSHDGDGIVQSFVRDITERKQAEEALKAAHEKLSATLNALPDLLFEVDAFGTIHDYIASHPEKLYVPPEKFIGKRVREVLPKPAVSIVEHAITDAVEHGKHRGAIYPLETPAGLQWFELSIASKGDTRSADNHFIVLAHDITDRKQAEEALRKSQKNLAEAQRIEHLGSYEYNFLTDTLFCSDEVFNIYGISSENFGGRIEDFFKFVHPDDQEHVRRIRETLLVQSGKGDYEHRIIRPDGSELIVYQRYETSLDKNGKTVSLIGTIQDITDQRLMKNALSGFQQELIIHNQISNIFLTKTEDEIYGTVLKVVIDALKSESGLLGYIDEHGVLVCRSKTKTAGNQDPKKEKDLVFPGNSWENTIWGDAIKKKECSVFNIPSTVPEGLFPIQRSLCVPIVHRDESIGIFIIANKPSDYSEHDKKLLENIADHVAPVLFGRLENERNKKKQKDLEDKLNQLRKEQEAFLRHELKNTLAPAKGYAELLVKPASAGLTEKQKKYANHINESLDRTIALIDTLKRLQDFEMGNYVLDTSDTNIIVALKQVIVQLELLSYKDSVPIELLDKTEISSTVCIDMNLFPGVFLNLIKNAIEHVGNLENTDEKVVQITVFNVNDRVVVKINNKGESVSPERVKLFFEKFNSDRTRKREGTGLGTTYAYLVTKAHGGDISVESNEKEGTTVTVTLRQVTE